MEAGGDQGWLSVFSSIRSQQPHSIAALEYPNPVRRALPPPIPTKEVIGDGNGVTGEGVVPVSPKALGTIAAMRGNRCQLAMPSVATDGSLVEYLDVEIPAAGDGVCGNLVEYLDVEIPSADQSSSSSSSSSLLKSFLSADNPAAAAAEGTAPAILPLHQQERVRSLQNDPPVGLLVEDAPGKYAALVNVFRLLPIHERMLTVPFVCREWVEAARDPSCYEDVAASSVIDAIAEGFAPEEVPSRIGQFLEQVLRLANGEIKVLRLSRCSDGELRAVSRECPLLKNLSVKGSSTLVTNAGIVSIARHCGNLTQLELEGCLKLTDAAIAEIAKHCHRVQRLGLSDCTRLTAAALNAIAQGVPDLRQLNVSGCVRIHDDGVVAVSLGCPNLLAIDLSGCEKITDIALVSLAEKCKRLQEVKINGCYRVTDDGAIGLVEHCKDVSSLHVSECVKLTTRMLDAVAENLHGLRDLDISCFMNLTDEALVTVLRHCGKLTNLNISGCSHITDQGLAAIDRLCPWLGLLNVRGCRGLSTDAITQLKRGCTNWRSVS